MPRNYVKSPFARREIFFVVFVLKKEKPKRVEIFFISTWCVRDLIERKIKHSISSKSNILWTANFFIRCKKKFVTKRVRNKWIEHFNKRRQSNSSFYIYIYIAAVCDPCVSLSHSRCVSDDLKPQLHCVRIICGGHFSLHSIFHQFKSPFDFWHLSA